MSATPARRDHYWPRELLHLAWLAIVATAASLFFAYLLPLWTGDVLNGHYYGGLAAGLIIGGGMARRSYRRDR